MVCLRFEPGAAGWHAQTKPRSYGGHPTKLKIYAKFLYRIRCTHLVALSTTLHQ